jgi:hypothetical protein
MSSVIATIAALATHIVLLNLAQLPNMANRDWNMLVIELKALLVEILAVQKRPKCVVCSNQAEKSRKGLNTNDLRAYLSTAHSSAGRQPTDSQGEC